MPCLEPDKKLTLEEQIILLLLKKLSSGDRFKIAEESKMSPPVVARKLRMLVKKGLLVQNGDLYHLNHKGEEAVEVLANKDKN